MSRARTGNSPRHPSLTDREFHLLLPCDERSVRVSRQRPRSDAGNAERVVTDVAEGRQKRLSGRPTSVAAYRALSETGSLFDR
jgi:hypothetical protein